MHAQWVFRRAVTLLCPAGSRDHQDYESALAISVHRQDSHTNIAAALCQAARDCHRRLTTLGLNG
ncbi:hypothetical protein JO379_000294 [Streptomyces syringium]|uniref:Uncharacterized protein n=1 Tax=Streptomyces syringium TaxID=76729 RepID=A0ABS4XWD0_9ACTN|nr:hypothetical protein [Streptomyces syringium]